VANGREKRYWVFKTESESYSWDDLVKDEITEWDGVRNAQARIYLRDEIEEGDGVLVYHSGKEKAVIGIAIVTRGGYPDFTAWDPDSDHPDPKSTPENPNWFMVDIRAVNRLARAVTLKEIKSVPALAEIFLITRSRLSVQPLSADAWGLITQMGAG
jgi:predicted RNA-binding protein with PUA-like domain